MKNILLSGYYGFQNTGDELVLSEIIRNLRKIDPDIRIVVMSADPEKTALQFKVEAVNRWSIFEIIKSIRRSNIVISGGGSLLQDKTSKNSILYYLGVIFFGKIFRKKVVIFSQGIGPIIQKRNIIITKIIVNWTDYLSVRDKESKEFLVSSGVDKNIYLAADPVFLIEKSDGQQKVELWEKLGLDPGKRLILLSFRPWDNVGSSIDISRDFLKFFSRDLYQIRYLSMYYGVDQEILIDKVPAKEIILEDLEPDEIAVLIGHSELVIGMRLHSLILAAAQGVKFIGISYDPKVSTLDREIYGEDIIITTENITLEMIKDKYEIVLETKEQISDIKKRALLPFEYIKRQIAN